LRGLAPNQTIGGTDNEITARGLASGGGGTPGTRHQRGSDEGYSCENTGTFAPGHWRSLSFAPKNFPPPSIAQATTAVTAVNHEICEVSRPRRRVFQYPQAPGVYDP
jgi:hypothetical protein